MKNQKENLENLIDKDISVQELQKQIAESKISSLNDKIAEINKSENSDNINNLENKNNLTSTHEAQDWLADIYLDIHKNQTPEKYTIKSNNSWNKGLDIYTIDGFATQEQADQIKLQADANRQKSSDKVQTMVDGMVSDFLPDFAKKWFT